MDPNFPNSILDIFNGRTSDMNCYLSAKKPEHMKLSGTESDHMSMKVSISSSD